MSKTDQIRVSINNVYEIATSEDSYEARNIIKVKLPLPDNENLIMNFMKNYLTPKLTYYIYLYYTLIKFILTISTLMLLK